MGLILFVANIALLGPKEAEPGQVLGPEILVSFVVASFSINRYSFQ